MIYRFATLGSSNDEACKPQYKEGDIILAERQEAGRGQRGHRWESGVGENLTFTIVFEPSFLPPQHQFLISECVALAMCDAMAEFGIEARIKWTNDIYARDSKLVGVLIEHSLAGDTLARTIVGIGLNVNQTEFPSDLPNPTSMALQRSAKFDREEVLCCFMRKLQEWYDVLLSGNKQLVESTYVSRMYHLLEEHPYMLPSGEVVRARIRGVRPSGELILEHDNGTVSEYAFKEIEFVLPHKSVQK
jgi:BirA family biotin operon repressor/biotin-[acetyl-CoA-carboxylase] ligase